MVNGYATTWRKVQSQEHIIDKMTKGKYPNPLPDEIALSVAILEVSTCTWSYIKVYVAKIHILILQLNEISMHL